MEEEILKLKNELENEKMHRLQLEDELDLLAVDNDRLRKLLASNGGVGSNNGATAFRSRDSGGGLIGNFSSTSTTVDPNYEWRELLVDGNNICADTLHTRIENACGGMNALCVDFCTCEGNDVIACGGVDKVLRIHSISTEGSALLQSYSLSAPILAIDSYGSLVGCSLMDGHHAIVDIAGDQDKEAVTIFKDHTKYVVCIKWSPDGCFLATVSHDKTINLYKRSINSEGKMMMVKVHTARFTVTPEYAVFAASTDKNTVHI
jgi:WD40 repeat protein